MQLPENLFRRYDESDDAQFYTQARLVTHIEDVTIGGVTQLYREFLPPEGAILDLMSSWVSHLPEEMVFSRVAGLGMNRQELQANPRLSNLWCVTLTLTPLHPSIPSPLMPLPAAFRSNISQNPLT